MLYICVDFKGITIKKWKVGDSPCKGKKAYAYMSSLLAKILLSRITVEMGMNQPVVLEADDQRRSPSHLAPFSPQPTDQLALELKLDAVIRQ